MGTAVAPKFAPGHVPELRAGERIVRSSVYCRAEAGNGKKAPNGEAYDVKIVASTGRVARDGGIILPTAWAADLSRFLANPIVQWCHQYDEPPVARAVFVQADEKTGLMIQCWRFNAGLSDDEWDRFANRLKVLYQTAALNAASVGFLVHEFRDPTNEERITGLAQDGTEPYWVATRAELLETSAVPVPSDPNALAVDRGIHDAERKGIAVGELKAKWERAKRLGADKAAAGIIDALRSAPPLVTRTAISYGSAHPDKNYSVAAKGASWDAGAEVKKMPAEKAGLRLRHAWVDPDKDADKKGSYKFPHHRGGSGAAVVFKACAAGFGRLGSAKIPAGEKDGVAAHLGKHYKADFDTDPPERSALEAAFAFCTAHARGAKDVGWMTDEATVRTLRALGGGDLSAGIEAMIVALGYEDTTTCPNCGAEVAADQDMCPYCGKTLPGKEGHAATVKCPGCGKQVVPTAGGACPECGATIRAEGDPEPIKCPHCGATVIPTKTGTCPECGEEIEGRAVTRVKCPGCGKEVTPTAGGACPECGATIRQGGEEQGELTCPNCGKSVKPDSEGKCPACGAEIVDPSSGSSTNYSVKELAEAVGELRTAVEEVRLALGTIGDRLAGLESAAGRGILALGAGDPAIEARVNTWLRDGAAELDTAERGVLDLEAVSSRVGEALSAKADAIIDRVLAARLGVRPTQSSH